MENSKVRTIWSLNGRAPDSRDVMDYTGHGLRVGRIDIPASETVTVDGYSKVEYRVTMGDGSVVAYPDFSAVISSMNGVVESKTGSKVMTLFLNDTGKESLGFFRIDVYKEWEVADPEPEDITVDDLAGISGRGLGLIKRADAFGIGGYASRTSWDDAATNGHTMFISTADGAPGSPGLNVMGISVTHTSGYTFQLGGRNGNMWVRFQEKGVFSEWTPLGGGSAFDPKPLEDKIAALEKRVAALEAAAPTA